MNRAELYTQIGTHGALAAPQRAIFELTGSDRVRYLNGQVSNDVRKLTAHKTMQACVMTAKGKMSADIFITEGKDLLRVDADISLRESLAARLERYIISDDVTLEDVSDKFSLVHLLHLIGAPDVVPVNDETAFDFKGPESRRYGRAGRDLFLAQEERQKLSDLINAFPSPLPNLDNEMLETLRIEAGIPRWGTELSEETIPVEAGLDKTAIDYHKGCYIGQEVISRIKSVGHVNKELRGFISTDGHPLEAGMALSAPDAPDKKAGWLTSVTYSFALEKPIALGYLKRGTVAETLIARRENDASGDNARPVLMKELPFIP